MTFDVILAFKFSASLNLQSAQAVEIIEIVSASHMPKLGNVRIATPYQSRYQKTANNTTEAACVGQ